MRMKYVYIACLFSIFAVAVVAGCVSQKPFSVREVEGFYVPNLEEELYGTWLNPAYEGFITKDAKLVLHKTGLLESFRSIKQTVPTETGVMIIIKKWKASDGSSWYITFFRSSTGGDNFGLHRVSKTAAAWEGFWTPANVSGSEESLKEDNLTPQHPHYEIYWRQQ